MIPYTGHLYCTVQNQPMAGILRVIGWNPTTNQPYLINIKTKGWQRWRQHQNAINADVGAAHEWTPNIGILIYHDTRHEADEEFDRMLGEVRDVLREADHITKEAAQR